MREQPVVGALGRYALLGATVLGTMANNVINVPLRDIAADLGAPVGESVLAVSAFIIVLAVAIPVTGWVGDRYGRRRILLGALGLMVVGQLLAAAATSLPFLIGARALQGLACSAIPPMVMGMLVTFFPAERLRMMGAWAAANGVGQAIGPPVGGFIASLVGWRAIFLLIGAASVATLLAVARSIPRVPAVPQRFDLLGASLLSTGMALLLAAATTLTLPGIGLVQSALTAGTGGILLAGYLLHARRPEAMLPVALLREARFARSCAAAFSQMFMFGTVLVAVPLHLTGGLDLSTWQAGVLFFQLPLVMFLGAPLVGRWGSRGSPLLILRVGLVVLTVGGVLAAVAIELLEGFAGIVGVSAVLVLLGAGMALVQTPSAAGATRSPAGARGAGLGVFNMLRFSGSAAGTAWVAVAYQRMDLAVLFGVASAVVLAGLAASHAGPNPQPIPEPGPAA